MLDHVHQLPSLLSHLMFPLKLKYQATDWNAHYIGLNDRLLWV